MIAEGVARASNASLNDRVGERPSSADGEAAGTRIMFDEVAAETKMGPSAPLRLAE